MKVSREQLRRLGIEPPPLPKREKRTAPEGPPPLALAQLAAWCGSMGFAAPEPEHRFHPVRLWAFDFAWVAERVALEVEGGVRKKGGGRHNRPEGFEEDRRKYNAAQLMGWVVLCYTTQQFKAGEQWDDLEKALTAEFRKGGAA